MFLSRSLDITGLSLLYKNSIGDIMLCINIKASFSIEIFIKCNDFVKYYALRVHELGNGLDYAS